MEIRNLEINDGSYKMKGPATSSGDIVWNCVFFALKKMLAIYINIEYNNIQWLLTGRNNNI